MARKGTLGPGPKAALDSDADFGYRQKILLMFVYLLGSRFRYIAYRVLDAEQAAPRGPHDDDQLLLYLRAVRRLPAGLPVLELAYADSKLVNIASDKARVLAARAAQEVWDVAVPRADRERASAALAASSAGCPHTPDVPSAATGIISLEVHAGEMALMRAALERNSKRSAPPAWLPETFPAAAAAPAASGGFRASFLTTHSPSDPRFHTAPYAPKPRGSSLAAWRASVAAQEKAYALAFAASPRCKKGRAAMIAQGLECVAPFSVDASMGGRAQPRPIRISDDTEEAAMTLLGFARMTQALTYEWAEGADRELAYVTLIDAYRLRVEDMEKFQRVRVGLAAGEDPIAGFAAFLAAARTRAGFLPADWTPSDDAAAMDLGTRHVWANLRRRAAKEDMVATYGAACMRHALLRSMAAVVMGSQVDTGAEVRFGKDGRALLRKGDSPWFHVP